jgi:hypothetical protein
MAQQNSVHWPSTSIAATATAAHPFELTDEFKSIHVKKQ